VVTTYVNGRRLTPENVGTAKNVDPSAVSATVDPRELTLLGSRELGLRSLHRSRGLS
jgi:hypothetical protein